MYAPPPAIRDLWPVPQLGDWAARDLNKPVPIAGGDGFRMPDPLSTNLPDNQPDPDDAPDVWANNGIGEPVDATTSQALNGNAQRGVLMRGAYTEQDFLKSVSHVVTHSLSREILYNWADAQFNVGGHGGGYPLDYGFGPGAHYDATVEMGNVQIYMRPGIYRRPTVK